MKKYLLAPNMAYSKIWCQENSEPDLTYVRGPDDLHGAEGEVVLTPGYYRHEKFPEIRAVVMRSHLRGQLELPPEWWTREGQRE